MKRHIYMLLILLCCTVFASAQHKRLSKSAIDSLQRMRRMEGSVGALRFKQYEHDMGAMFESDTARTVRFPFCNSGDNDVTILKVTTTCGCAVASYSRQPVAPGDSGVVSITFSPRGKAGTVDADAFVYTDTATGTPSAHLLLRGNVIGSDEWDYLPVQMGSLRLKSSSVRFDISRKGVYVERIVCANVGIKPLELKSAILPSFMTFRTEPAILQPGEEGDIVITANVAPMQFDDACNRHFKIVLEGVECRPSQRTINVEIAYTQKRTER